MMKKINARFTAAAAALMITAGTLAAPVSAAQSAPSGDAMMSARSSREFEAQTMNSNYLLPDSDTYYITEADISWMDDNELMLARNEFYARRGRKFATKSIQDYFNRQGWYTGTINPDDFTSEMFNRYEQANVDFIVAYEKKRKEFRAQRKKERKPKVAQEYSNPTAEEYPPEYGEIVDLYGDALLDGWVEDDFAVSGLNEMASEIEKPGDLGYIYMDLDDDGNEELLIGPTDPQLYGEGAVFEIYMMEDGIPVEIASSDEDCIYYICEDKTIRREAIQDDGNWEISYFDLKGGDLVCKKMLVMDESLNREEPWFVVNDAEDLAVIGGDGFEGEDTLNAAEDYEAISYEDASNIRAGYVGMSIDFIPYSE
jgi:hypothetical protein